MESWRSFNEWRWEKNISNHRHNPQPHIDKPQHSPFLTKVWICSNIGDLTQVWRRLAAIQMRSNPGLVRLAKALGWPHHQVEERQAKVQREKLLDGNMQLLEESDGGRGGDLLDLQQRTDLENRVNFNFNFNFNFKFLFLT